MTHRERFCAVLEGKVPDRTVWVPRLDIWYHAHQAAGTLPEPLAGLSLFEVEEYLGMGHSCREGVVFKVCYDSLEEVIHHEGHAEVHRFLTPVGEVRAARTHLPDAQRYGLSSIPTEHYLKSPLDFDVMRYVVEHTRYVPDYESYERYDRQVGPNGYPLVVLGASPIHQIMLHYAGYEAFYYFLADCPEKVEALLEAMEASYRQMWEVVAASPAQFVLHGVHFSSAMTPPPIFRRYFLPYFRAFNERMHRAGIRVAFHADADLTGLLDLVRECDFDVADTFACAPLVRTTFDEARAAWEERIVIWGGVPSIILEPSYPWDAFQQYVRELHRKTVGRPHFIMAVSDNIMPSAEFERLVWIRDFLAENG